MPANCKGTRRCATEARHNNAEISAVQSHTLYPAPLYCWHMLGMAGIHPLESPSGNPPLHTAQTATTSSKDLPKTRTSDSEVSLQVTLVSTRAERDFRSEPTADSAPESIVKINPSAPGLRQHMLVDGGGSDEEPTPTEL